LILCIFVFIGGQIADGILNKNPGVSQIGHILGGLSGAVFGFFFNKNKLVTGKSETKI
jgi:membrane associated rhomboid family serine protease